MEKNKTFNYIILAEFIIILVQLYNGSFKDYIHYRLLAEGAKLIIEKTNFISPMTWGYGNYFPLLFLASLVLAGLILFLEFFKKDKKEAKLSLNIVIFAGFLFILIPMLIGMEIVNFGLLTMLIMQVILLLANMLRARI